MVGDVAIHRFFNSSAGGSVVYDLIGNACAGASLTHLPAGLAESPFVGSILFAEQ